MDRPIEVKVSSRDYLVIIKKTFSGLFFVYFVEKYILLGKFALIVKTFFIIELENGGRKLEYNLICA